MEANPNSLLITLMRHGRSRADDEGVHEGRYDSPLTDAGRAQVQRRAAEFVERQFTFDAVIASPLVRASETARIIAGALGLSVETDPDWMEMDNGPLAGMPFDEAEARYPRPAFRNPYEPFCGSGESDWQFYIRAARAVDALVKRGLGSVLVVAHGGVLNSALRAITGATPVGNWQGFHFWFGDTGYVRLKYYPGQHTWVLAEFNPGEHTS